MIIKSSKRQQTRHDNNGTIPSVARDRVQSHGGAVTASVVRQHPCNALLMFILQKVARELLTLSVSFSSTEYVSLRSTFGQRGQIDGLQWDRMAE